MNSFLTLLPSILAVFLALKTKNVFIALGSGIILSYLLLNNFAIYDSLKAIYELFYSLLSEGWVVKTLAFAIMAGSIINLIENSGGVEGFVALMQKSSLIKSQRSVLMLSYIVGVIIFIESSITSLVAGAVGKPFCHRYKIPNEKLAFVCDSTSAPISSLIAINGWGALLLGLISTQVTLGIINQDATRLLIDSLFLNFYSIAILIITFLFIYFSVDLGSMKRCVYKEQDISSTVIKSSSAIHMLLPMFLMVALVFVFLYITGNGDIFKGSGSSAIFYTMLSVLVVMFFQYIFSGVMSIKSWGKIAFDGAIKFVPITLILLLAFAIGDGVTQLKTGSYLASLLGSNLPRELLAASIFVISAIISFSTGTSWGTFSIMMPIALPMAVAMDAYLPLTIGAVISGGVFGDHCSPISDTTIISSMASDCEIASHVNTQLPYALLGAFIAFLLFIIFGFIL